MKFLYIIFTITVLNVLLIKEITAISSEDGVCNKTGIEIIRSAYSHPHHILSDWHRSADSYHNDYHRLSHNYPIFKHVSIFACCQGYEKINDSKCIPICQPPCGNGTCVRPDECNCHDGYGQIRYEHHQNDTTAVCMPICTQSCSHGQCIAPETCSCNHQYSLSVDGYTCEPVCIPNCGTGSFCYKPNNCTCLEGYTTKNNTVKEDLNTGTYNLCIPVCDNECINGQCTDPNTCTCNVGYELDPENIFICEPKCDQNCVNGVCTAPNVCTCNDGFRHNSSDESTKHICKSHCEISCQQFSTCTAPNICSCNPGYHSSGNRNICEPICSNNCINGFCSAPETCTCNKGYQLSNSSNVCELICQIDCVNGYCNAPDECTCNSGYKFDEANRTTMRQTICKPICNVSCGNGTCTAPDFCTCLDGYHKTETGTCKPVCSQCNNGTCTAPNVCKCDDGFVWSMNNFTNTSGCVPYCENCDNGECVMPHKCRCYPGFVNIEDTCMAACKNGCGTHGKCMEKRRICECDYGWTGLQCDQPTLCVLFLNFTEQLKIIEQNATIKHVLQNNPVCSKCIARLNNETLCFKINFNDANNGAQIGCLMNGECIPSISQSRLRSLETNRSMDHIKNIAGVFGILLLISTVAVSVILVLRRKYRNNFINLVEDKYTTSMQGLIIEDSEDK